MKRYTFIITVICVIVIQLIFTIKNNAEKEEFELFFDFGSQYTYGWERVDKDTEYNAGRGYGFTDVSLTHNESVNNDGVLSDAVAVDNENVTFNVDIPEGIYRIQVYTGNIEYMTIDFEGYPTILNTMFPGLETEIEIPVTDGQLNMSLEPGTMGENLSISAMTVERIGDIPERKKHVFIIGDSTAATFYPTTMYQPLKESYRGGWGQMLHDYVSDSLYVQNMASPGQSAKSFIEKGILDSTMYYMEKNDYVLISLGINDKMKYSENEFREYLDVILTEIKNKGGIPIIIAEPDKLDNYTIDDEYAYEDNCYSDVLKNFAEENMAAYVDLRSAFSDYLRSLPYSEIVKMYWTEWDGSKDNIHFSRNGAGQVARILTEQLRIKGYNELSSYVTDYGISADKRIKCRKQKECMLFENTTLHDITLRIILNNEDETSTVWRSIDVPAYDVLDPGKSVITAIPETFNGEITAEDEDIYITVDNGEIQ